VDTDDLSDEAYASPGPRYDVLIRWSDADNTFIAEVPELPGCIADGFTYEAALAAVKVVVSEWIESASAVGRSIPAHQSRRSATALAKPRYTRLQEQYLAFIDNYSKMYRQPPAEADLQRHFRVTPPSVHQMILTLHRKGLIERTPGAARSIRVVIPASEIPALE
jgi:predicted RNase H-like HicB family nuclease